MAKNKTDAVYKLDQFFTKEEIVVQCLQELQSIYNLEDFSEIIEPSAGMGNFVNKLPSNTIAIEIDNELCKGKTQYKNLSFFDFTIEKSKILVIGNPPFGIQNNLSVNFFNHAACFAEVIAFIIPKTWNKTSIHNRLNKNYHLIKSIDLPKDCFYGTKFTDVKCCFQIWQYSANTRIVENNILCHKDWEFITLKVKNKLSVPLNADFVISAFGKAGQISTNLFKWKPKSVYFIKSNIDSKELMKRFESLDYSVSNNSARQSSLPKSDLVKLYCEKYGK